MPNKDALERAGIPSMFAMLSQRRLRWLGGHTRCMEDGRLPKDVLYGELASGSRPVGRPMLRYKNVCKAAADLSNWRHIVRTGVRKAEARREELWHNKRERQRARAASAPSQPTSYTCSNCNKDCLSRIGLCSHSRRCSAAN